MNNNTILYRHRFSEVQRIQKDKVWRIICKTFLQQWVNPHQDTVLDIAVGNGEFLNHIEAKRKIGFDINPDSAQWLAPNTLFYNHSLLEIDTHLKEKVDLIFASNILEHLPNKETLEMLLEKVRHVLQPKGRFLILGPNLRYLPATYWDFYDHHLGLTDRSLIEVLNLKGFKPVHVIDRFLPYTTQSALPKAPFLVQLYLRCPLAWKLLGKQFFVVATPQ